MALTHLSLALGLSLFAGPVQPSFPRPRHWAQAGPDLGSFGSVPDRMTCDWLDVLVRGRIDLRPLGGQDGPFDLGAFDADEWVRLFESAGAASIHVRASSAQGGLLWTEGAGLASLRDLSAACERRGLGFGLEMGGANADIGQIVLRVHGLIAACPGIDYLVLDGGRRAGHPSADPRAAMPRFAAEFSGHYLFERSRQGMTWCPGAETTPAGGQPDGDSAGAPAGDSTGDSTGASTGGAKEVRPGESPARGRHFAVATGVPSGSSGDLSGRELGDAAGGGMAIHQKVLGQIEAAWQVGGACEILVNAKGGGAPPDGAPVLLQEVGAMVRDRLRVDVLRAAVQRGGAVHGASNVRGGAARFDGTQVLDPRPGTFWAMDDGIQQGAPKGTGSTLGWVEFQLAEPITFDQLVLAEPAALGFRQQVFRLEAWVDGKWYLAHRGKLSGGRYEARFTEVSTRRVRLSIDAAATTPAISRLALFRSPPSVTIEPPGSVSLNPVRVKLAARAGALVRYTLDGSAVHGGSPKYTEPILVKETVQVRARAFDGDGGALREAFADIRIITEDEWRVAVSFARPPGAGLSLERFEGDWSSLDQMGERRPASRAIVPGIDAARDAPRREQIALRYKGHLLVPRDGLYTFSSESDDGSRIRIHGELVVDNDGLHSMRLMSGKVALRAGYHPIEITWFNARGAAGLDVRWSGPNVGRRALLSPDVLFQ